MRGTVLCVALALGTGLGGCASSSAGDTPVGASRDVTTAAESRTGYQQPLRQISEERMVDGLLVAPVERGWEQLPGVFEELGIEVTHSDPRTHVMGNRGFRVRRRIGGERPAEYLDCGTGPTAQPYANAYEVTMGLLVQLSPVEDGTRVRIRMEATAKPRDVSGHAVTCSSKGTLEQRILSMLQP